MIKPEQVPQEVIVAAVIEAEHNNGSMRSLIAAALNAWPGMDVMPFGDGVSRVRLPLTQEKTDGNYDYAGGL